MQNDAYLPRVLDKAVRTHLNAFGAVCLEGPKWCGKTWTGRFHAASEICIANPEGGFQNRRLARMNPLLILEGERPRLIDEWQEEPSLWDATRMACDADRGKGKFILTGSSTPVTKGKLHSGAGRIARLRMRPMSLFEARHSSGRISLQDICTGTAPDTLIGEVSLGEIVKHIVRGGWPENIDAPLEMAALLPGQYINAILSDDLFRLDEKRRDIRKMGQLLRSLARNESTTASNKTLQRDIEDAGGSTIGIDTVAEYLTLFDRLFLIENQKPFSSSMRSSVRVKQLEKRHLCDPSLACALLGATPAMLMNDLNTLGFLFESLVERDLRIYAESFGATLYHYQDYKDKELDAVIELADGAWCGIEIKLGANEIDSGAANLLAIRDAFAADPRARAPQALCVICGLANAAYMRPDGVYVVPLTALRP